MLRQYPMTTVPNLQGFPENGYPVSAYYGIDSTLASMSAQSPGGTATSGGKKSDSLMPNPSLGPGNYRTVIVAFLLIVGAVTLWHFYMK